MMSVAASPSGKEAGADSSDRGWRAVVEGMSLIVLEQPTLWLPALAGFLVRGGFLLFALPILVLPSAVGLGNFVGPTSVTAAGPSGGLLILFLAALAISTAWLAAAAVIGSVVDRMLILRHAELLHGRLTPWGDGGSAATLGELVSIRLLLLVPVGIAVGWAGQRLVEVGYQELILPTNLDSPLLIRVIGRGADGLVVLAVVWLACETLGATAVRHSVMTGASVPRALAGAGGHLLRHPLSTAATAFLGLAASAAFLLPAVLGLSVAWNGLRTALVDSLDASLVVLALTLFLAVWMAGLLLAGLLAAWRSAIWTGEMVRFDIARSGDRSMDDETGKL
jgi:hypothetical protein